MGRARSEDFERVPSFPEGRHKRVSACVRTGQVARPPNQADELGNRLASTPFA